MDIEQEVQREQEWTRSILNRGIPNIVPPAQPERDEEMPQAESPLPPLTPSPEPAPQPMHNIDDLYEGQMDIDSLIECGHHHVLNHMIAKAAA